jgi:hypothetical protein
MKKRMMKLAIIAMGFQLFAAGSALAAGFWNDHLKPFDFMFGNHIDTHQQTMVLPNGQLKGFLYIEFTGEYTEDGYPVAAHTDCTIETAVCEVGWTWRGVPGEATFVYQESGDHPFWQVSSRNDIPQPGAFGHFHWLDQPEEAMDLMEGMTYEGYFLELTAKNTFVFRHGDEEILVTPGIDLATHLNIVSSFPVLTDGGGH